MQMQSQVIYTNTRFRRESNYNLTNYKTKKQKLETYTFSKISSILVELFIIKNRINKLEGGGSRKLSKIIEIIL